MIDIFIFLSQAWASKFWVISHCWTPLLVKIKTLTQYSLFSRRTRPCPAPGCGSWSWPPAPGAGVCVWTNQSSVLPASANQSPALPVYGGRGGGDHPGGVMAQVQLGVTSLVNIGPGARLDLRGNKIYVDKNISEALA